MHDDRPVSAIGRVFRLMAGETITPFLRAISASVCVSMFALGWQPLLDPHAIAYQNPVFESIRAVAALPTWGIMFWVCGILLGVAAVSARAIIYLIGVVLSSVLLTGWCVLVVLEATVDADAHLTSGAIGFYILSLTAVAGMAGVPQQIVHETDVVGVVDDVTVPLRVIKHERQTG